MMFLEPKFFGKSAYTGTPNDSKPVSFKSTTGYLLLPEQALQKMFRLSFGYVLGFHETQDAYQSTPTIM